MSRRLLGVAVCALAACGLAVASIYAGDWYWLFLIGGSLLGVLAGIIYNLPDERP